MHQFLDNAQLYFCALKEFYHSSLFIHYLILIPLTLNPNNCHPGYHELTVNNADVTTSCLCIIEIEKRN